VLVATKNCPLSPPRHMLTQKAKVRSAAARGWCLTV
jgi:hypothetical protein